MIVFAPAASELPFTVTEQLPLESVQLPSGVAPTLKFTVPVGIKLDVTLSVTAAVTAVEPPAVIEGDVADAVTAVASWMSRTVAADVAVWFVLAPGVVAHVSATVMLYGPGPIFEPVNEDEQVLRLEAETAQLPSVFGVPVPTA